MTLFIPIIMLRWVPQYWQCVRPLDSSQHSQASTLGSRAYTISATQSNAEKKTLGKKLTLSLQLGGLEIVSRPEGIIHPGPRPGIQADLMITLKDQGDFCKSHRSELPLEDSKFSNKLAVSFRIIYSIYQQCFSIKPCLKAFRRKI